MSQTQGEYVIPAENELRCEVRDPCKLTIILREGVAEIFGIDMIKNSEYTFVDQYVAVFSWYGCKVDVKVEGTTDITTVVYCTSSSPSMIQYVNTHAQLESLRDVAVANRQSGPKVLVLGSCDQELSLICRILACFAARMDRCPIYVDLDVSQGTLSIPGCIGAIQVDKTSISIQDEFLGSVMPLLYYFGSTSPSTNLDLFHQYVEILLSRVNERMRHDLDALTSGCIINGAGVVSSDDSIDIISKILQWMKIDVILVVYDDKLFSRLSQAFPSIKVIYQDALRRGVTRDPSKKKKDQIARVEHYFYGQTINSEIASSRITVPLTTVKFYQAGAIQVTQGMRPIDQLMSTATSTASLIPVTASSVSIGQVLALLHQPDDPNTTDLTQLLKSNVAGFIYVEDISLMDNRMVVRSPYPGNLPSSILLVGNIKYVVSQMK